ncbi:MAG: translation initiation factor IF-2 [Patescibacteria group bacterium]|jgi:translation initiation factor IF-2
MPETSKPKIEIPSRIIVRDLAVMIKRPVTDVIAQLMQNGIMSSLNEWIDYETAAVITEDMGFEPSPKAEDAAEEAELEQLLKPQSADRLQPRPPVVVIMGHVDHGKTRLLDTIRETDVMAGEAGGITQHIGAYQVNKKGRQITFIDTPGHEAFTAMRSRGARVADIGILIVAADDGVKPQTVEAINIIKKSHLPMIVAINKIDLPEANVERVKQQLSEHEVLVEGWGGQVPVAEISAKDKRGVSELLDLILLVADLNKQNIVADPTQDAVGTVIESHIDKGSGPVATVVIQTGTLHVNDLITVGGLQGGKVKAIKNHLAKAQPEATPSQAVEIFGLKLAAKVGDILTVIDKKELYKIKKQKQYTPTTPTVHLKKKDLENESSESSTEPKKLNVILKADTLGSLEAIIESLKKIHTPEASVHVVAKSLGNITEADVLRATTAQARLYGFNVTVTPQAEDVARGQEYVIQTFKIIYDLVNAAIGELEQMLPPDIIRTVTGELNVLAVFQTKLPKVIAGGKVFKGKLHNGSKVAVLRQQVEIATGKIEQLQLNKEGVDEVNSGRECGMKLNLTAAVQAGDTIQAYTETTRLKKLILS